MGRFNTEGLKSLIKYMSKGKLIGLSLEDYNDKKARDCGCGRDCCDNTEHWVDVITKTRYVTYIKNGVLTTKTLTDYKANGY